MSSTDVRTESIRIGEQCFYLDKHSSVRLGCDSLDDFERMYERIFSTPNLKKEYSLDTVKSLCKKYLPFSGPTLDTITSEDKKKLIAILELYREDIINNSAASNGNSLLQSRFRAYLPSVKALIEQLSESSKQKAKKADKLKTILDKFDEKKIPFILMRLAWLLKHPDKITANYDVDDSIKLFESIQSLKLDKLIESLNGFKDDTSLPSMDDFKKAKDVGALSKSTQSDDFKSLFKEMVTILTAKGYLDQSYDKERLEKRLPRSLIPKDTNSSSFRLLSPLFTMVFGVYDPVVVRFIESIKTYESLPAILVPLMKLSYVMNHLWALPNDNPKRDRLFSIAVSNDVVEYLGSHIGALNDFIQNNAEDKELVTKFRNIEKVTEAEYFAKKEMPYVFLYPVENTKKQKKDSIFLLRTSDDTKKNYELPIEQINLEQVDLSVAKPEIMIQLAQTKTKNTVNKETTIGRVLFQLILLRQLQLTYPEISAGQIKTVVPPPVAKSNTKKK